MAKEIFLLRHARTADSGSGRFLGATDAPLDARGEADARAMAGALKALAPGHCLSSPKARCLQTARLALPSAPITVDDDLREVDFGRWEGLTFEEAVADDPAAVDRWAAFDPDFTFPGGESLAGFLARVHAAADRLASHGADTVLAVTHGGVIRAMLCHLLGLDPRQYVLFDIPCGALAAIRLFEGKGVLSYLGRPATGAGRPL